MKRLYIIIAFLLMGVQTAEAKIDLVTLPTRDTTQITIYNSADLTLVRESRSLTLREGLNNLQFSWVNTLIDPTSLEMIPQSHYEDIDIFDLTYPPRVNNLGLWHIRSEVSGKVPVEINYLTSGLSWRAFYMGTLTEDEKNMRLQGYVRVMNYSGEDYENAQVRLIVGKVHMVDQIAALARRKFAFGSPIQYFDSEKDMVGRKRGVLKMKAGFEEAVYAYNDRFDVEGSSEIYANKKEIIKEGLSEYFLYTIEGKETIANGWSKRLPSFEAEEVPVINLYKFEEERYGHVVVRFLSFNNDEDHKLGDTPIPGGIIKVFRNMDEYNHLSYEGQSNFKYIPVEEEVELNLGNVENVVVKPTMMNYQTKNYRYDYNGNIAGWDEVREYKIEVKNTRDIPVKVQIKRNFGVNKWKLKNDGDYGEYEKVDKDTAKYTLEIGNKSKKEFRYTITTYQGINAG